MKTSLKTAIKKRGRNPILSWLRAVPLGLLGFTWITPVQAENVDSEILLLVDITRPGLNQSQFERLMDGYADAFTSNDVMDSIQSGAYGRIAVSMMFFGESSTQIVGIPWMSIGNATEALQFASLAQSVSRPFQTTNSDIAAAITAATLSFGTETGGTSNGFESVVQVVEVATARLPSAGEASAASAASMASLDAGVDLINSLALGSGSRANAIENFYASNVIGSTIDGVAPTSTASQINGGLASTMNGLFSESVQTGATVAANAVPEPSTMLGLLPATLLLLRRKRR